MNFQKAGFVYLATIFDACGRPPGSQWFFGQLTSPASGPGKPTLVQDGQKIAQRYDFCQRDKNLFPGRAPGH